MEPKFSKAAYAEASKGRRMDCDNSFNDQAKRRKLYGGYKNHLSNNYQRQQYCKPEVQNASQRERRDGHLQNLERERAMLLQVVNQQPPPPWNEASSMWTRIDRIEQFLSQQLEREKGVLLGVINQQPPPPWNEASLMWNRIDVIEQQLEILK